MVGRPSDYNDTIAGIICTRISAGESLTAICDEEGMPSIMSVYRWIAAHPTFREDYARARETQGDLMDRLIMEAAVAPPERIIIRMGGDEGGTKEQVDTGEVQHRRLKIDALKWRAAHLRPKVYGVKQTLEHTGKVTIEDLVVGNPPPDDAHG